MTPPEKNVARRVSKPTLYGIAREIMDPMRRTTEIGNWLRAVVLPRRGLA
jgi:hypothetical protein